MSPEAELQQVATQIGNFADLLNQASEGVERMITGLDAVLESQPRELARSLRSCSPLTMPAALHRMIAAIERLTPLIEYTKALRIKLARAALAEDEGEGGLA